MMLGLNGVAWQGVHSLIRSLSLTLTLSLLSLPLLEVVVVVEVQETKCVPMIIK